MMEHKQFTLRQIAARIIALDALAPENEQFVYNQVRGLANNGLISPVSKPGRRGSVGHYSASQAAKARLMVELINCGYLVADLRVLAEHIHQTVHFVGRDRPASMRLEGGYTTGLVDGFEQARLGAELGEDWRLRIERWLLPNGMFEMHGHLRWAGDGLPDVVAIELQGARPRRTDEYHLVYLISGFES